MSANLDRIEELLSGNETQRTLETGYWMGTECWRCEARDAEGELGLCAPCAEVLRSEKPVETEEDVVAAWLAETAVAAPESLYVRLITPGEWEQTPPEERNAWGDWLVLDQPASVYYYRSETLWEAEE